MNFSLLFLFLLLSISTVGQISPDCSTAIPICDNTPVNSGTDGYGIDDFDGVNDNWSIYGWSELTDANVFIFDKYGKLIKQLTSSQTKWDGTYFGKQMPASDYWFKLTYVDNSGAKTEANYLNRHFSLKKVVFYF